MSSRNLSEVNSFQFSEGLVAVRCGFVRPMGHGDGEFFSLCRRLREAEILSDTNLQSNLP
jgi:hypothetical protein